MSYKRIFSEIFLFTGCFVILVVTLNPSFFWKNLAYTFVKPLPAKTPVLQKTYDKNFLIVPSLDITAPVVYVEERSEVVYQAALKHGVVHYPATAQPGEYGAAYIFGHSSDLPWIAGDYKTVFALLPRIRPGAEVILTDWNGNPFVYTVTDAFVAAANAVQYLDPQQYKKRLLILQTSYPLGTALRRYIVIAEMKAPDANDTAPRKRS